jgi:hypothetical protein
MANKSDQFQVDSIENRYHIFNLNISPAIEHVKVRHAGLDPASSHILDSRFSREGLYWYI